MDGTNLRIHLRWTLPQPTLFHTSKTAVDADAEVAAEVAAVVALTLFQFAMEAEMSLFFIIEEGKKADPEEKARKLNAELNNGRAAMMGIIGNMVAEKLTGQTMYEQYAAGHVSPFGDGS
ncbi:hypothetical protein ScalyP_jg10151 [Parmales sp. scaly parma]|nr:hypothetical protein ScalyP_jg10151 [Parmales sp. scaly parma]